jgi:hypothetical protein
MANCWGTRLATVRRYVAGLACRTRASTSDPWSAQSWARAAMNSSPNLFREPFGRPAGLPERPGSNGRPTLFFCCIIIHASGYQLYFGLAISAAQPLQRVAQRRMYINGFFLRLVSLYCPIPPVQPTLKLRCTTVLLPSLSVGGGRARQTSPWRGEAAFCVSVGAGRRISKLDRQAALAGCAGVSRSALLLLHLTAGAIAADPTATRPVRLSERPRPAVRAAAARRLDRLVPRSGDRAAPTGAAAPAAWRCWRRCAGPRRG